MSMIAAFLVQAANPGAPGVTAAQVMAAHRAATSIGRDPCRPGAGADGGGEDDEIVVCGRRGNPYALPGYDPLAGSAASQAGGGRARQMERVRDASGPCASQGAQCLPPALNLLAVVPMIAARAAEALTDGE